MKFADPKISKLIVNFENKILKGQNINVELTENIFLPKDSSDTNFIVSLNLKMVDEKKNTVLTIESSCSVEYSEDDSTNIKQDNIRKQVTPVIYESIKKCIFFLRENSVMNIPALPDKLY